MSPGAVRRLVVAVCVVGIGGMIAGSVADSNGVALTFGLVTAAAVLCLLVASSVAAGGAPADPDAQAARLETLVSDMVADGADEARLRRLVGEAVKLGRGLASRPDA